MLSFTEASNPIYSSLNTALKFWKWPTSHLLQIYFQRTKDFLQNNQFTCLFWDKNVPGQHHGTIRKKPEGKREGSTDINSGKEKLPEIKFSQTGRGYVNMNLCMFTLPLQKKICFKNFKESKSLCIYFTLKDDENCIFSYLVQVYKS